MKIEIPNLALVVLIGASGSGKSTFAHKHFRSTEVLSSDVFRGMVADDPTDQSASKAAFEVLHFITEKRLAAGKLTVIDATNLSKEARAQLIAIAKKHHVMLVGILFDLPTEVCLAQNQMRTLAVPDGVVKRQTGRLRRMKKWIKKEGFRYYYTLQSREAVDEVEIKRTPLRVDRRDEIGAFDIIGDVHGCFTELCALLQQLDYQITTHNSETGQPHYQVQHPAGRRVVFVGDLVDRGPDSPRVLQLVMDMVKAGQAFSVCGNHDDRLMRKLSGKKVHLRHGLADTLQQMEAWPAAWQEHVYTFLRKTPHHLVLDQGRLVVAHAGLIEEYHGRSSGKVRNFALYGDTTGERDEYGFPVRRNWAQHYHGKACVVYGHTPVETPIVQNGTMNIDTGCVFGGRLTAMRYPEQSFVSVAAARTYAELSRPMFSKQDFFGGATLNLTDVYGDKQLVTQFHSPIRIYPDQSAAALEAMSRFVVDPRWLIYLPPTMSPSETTKTGDLLEHPQEAFRYYRETGVEQVVCEEKHMGSRAVVIVCRDESVARKRFGIETEEIGICYTRTGRRFFRDSDLEQAMLKRVQTALTKSGFWDELATDWVCLDAELMPWSAKAEQLLVDQYASVGAASKHALQTVVEQLQQAQQNGQAVDELLTLFTDKQTQSHLFTEAYRRYCWPAESLADYRLAPFHILATEGHVHHDRDHRWHMETIAQICATDPELLLATTYRIVELADESAVAAATHWWEELTAQGGEGMVVKPLDFLVRGERGLIQPAIKCRGREYLRIIYGPDYTTPENLERLRMRGLKKKRSLATREFALGLEALERFVAQDPLNQVHPYCFGILALESEPIDPRL